MNTIDIAMARDPDLRASLTALRRAASLARKEAMQTDTDLVVVVDGKLFLIQAKTLSEEEKGYKGQ